MTHALLLAAALAQAPNGQALFENNCTNCHTAAGAERTPSIASLRQRTPEAVLDALTTGVMRQQGADLREAERRAIAEYLGGRALGSSAAVSSGSCASAGGFDASSGPRWTGWSSDVTNRRFQPAADAALTADQVPRLTLKWAFGFANAVTARGLPTVAGGRVFVGNQNRSVYSLDAKTGCSVWSFQAKGGVRTGIVIGPRNGMPGKYLALFGDERGNAYGLDAATGEEVWTRNVEDHPNVSISGTPTLYQNRLYVPVSSTEEVQGNNKTYECCKFRGSMVALDASTGALLWKTYTISGEAKPVGKNPSGTTRWGPSGAAIWSSPTVDAKRRVVYAATGNMYTEPQQPTSDAIIAFDLDSGAIKWTSQVMAKDIFVMFCNVPNAANCPAADDVGPDFDFGNAPILVTLPGGRDLIVVGQKSGIGWAFDPDNRGKVVWQYRAGNGGMLGGLEFGSAVDDEQAYFVVSDVLGGEQPGGLHAVKLASGERAWFAPPPPAKCGSARGCNTAVLAAVTVIPGVVFTGSNDGAVRGWSTKDGSLLWEYDTNRDFDTVNGVPAKGATINGPGAVVAGGMLFINSGYGLLGGRAGNVLLAFSVP